MGDEKKCNKISKKYSSLKYVQENMRDETKCKTAKAYHESHLQQLKVFKKHT